MLTHQRSFELRRAVGSVLNTAVPPPGAGWELAELLVVDNNPDGSAEPIVAELRRSRAGRRSSPESASESIGESGRESAAAVDGSVIRYVHEAEPGIVPARNRALDEARGDVLVFIDDDEIALPGWPDGLLATMERTSAALVGGPVVTEFVEAPPPWVIDGRFFDIPTQPDGSTRTWLSTCNLAIDLHRIRAEGIRFDDRFPFGEDAAFSRLAASRGLPLRWSATATVKEYVEPERTTLAWRRNRHRISTDAWVRAELDLDDSPPAQARVLARAVSRLVQGAGTTVIGLVSGREATRNEGLARMSQARGGVEGWLTHRAHGRHSR